MRFFDKNPVGRLMTRVTSDVESLNQMFTQGIVTIFGDIFLLLGIIIAMLYLDYRLALWTFSVIPVLFAARVQDTRYREGHLWETLVRICENLGW